MSRYITRVVVTMRVDSESEAKAVIAEAQKDSHFNLTKHSSEYKERKQKGEVIDAYYKVVLTEDFNNEKEPDTEVKITYDTCLSAFPSPVVTDDEEENND